VNEQDGGVKFLFSGIAYKYAVRLL